MCVSQGDEGVICDEIIEKRMHQQKKRGDDEKKLLGESIVTPHLLSAVFLGIFLWFCHVPPSRSGSSSSKVPWIISIQPDVVCRKVKKVKGEDLAKAVQWKRVVFGLADVNKCRLSPFCGFDTATISVCQRPILLTILCPEYIVTIRNRFEPGHCLMILDEISKPDVDAVVYSAWPFRGSSGFIFRTWRS